MNNRLIKRNFLGVSTMCLMACLFLFLSCGSDDKLSEEGDVSQGKPYLALKQYGMNKLAVANNVEEATYTLAVCKRGGKSNVELAANLDVWSEEELGDYNKKEKKSYVLLPDEYYFIPSKKVIFASDANEVDVEIKIKASKIIAEMEQGVNYVIALKLSSEEVDLRKGQCDLLLHIAMDYATVEFVSTDVVGRINVKDATTYAKIKTILNYKVDGKDNGSAWDFVCELKVPENAEELVAAYNKEYNSNCELLPSNSYSLGKAEYAIGDKEAEGTVTINRDAIQVKWYLLPLTLANASTGEVICKDEVYYTVVGQTYTNPIITEKGVADPTVFRDPKDGKFYLYSTVTGSDWMPIFSSDDLVNWKYEKNAFRNATKPSWNTDNAFWAPEMRYINGKYVLYYSWAKMNGTAQSHTNVVTADTPLGTYDSTLKDKVFAGSIQLLSNEEFGYNCIDQFYYEENDRKFLFYGSFNGIWVVELTDDGLAVKRGADNKPVFWKKVCGNAFEGTNIYKKGEYYYLFASIGACCAGANSNYEVVVGRSNSLFGPYVDKNGTDMLENAWEPVVDGGDRSKWVGPGHNSILVVDDEGTEWMIYHSYGYWSGSFGGRNCMLDRLLWTEDGWPYVKNHLPSDSDLIPVFYAN